MQQDPDQSPSSLQISPSNDIGTNESNPFPQGNISSHNSQSSPLDATPSQPKHEQKYSVRDQDDNEKDFMTPNHYKIDSGPTLDTERNTMAVSNSKKKSNLKKRQANKNFVEKNMQVKTTFSERKKSRQVNTSQISQTEYVGRYSMPKATYQKQTHQRLNDWSRLNQRNSLLSVEKTSQSGQKNASKDFVVKHIEVSINNLMGKSQSIKTLGGTFSQNRREKWYHQTNSSSITNLRSYQSLDVPLGQEDKPFPTTKGNQALKRAMNQSQVFPRTNMFLKEESLPDNFSEHKGKRTPVHNVNNVQVQSMRLRNLSSQIF